MNNVWDFCLEVIDHINFKWKQWLQILRWLQIKDLIIRLLYFPYHLNMNANYNLNTIHKNNLSPGDLDNEARKWRYNSDKLRQNEWKGGRFDAFSST